MMIKIFVFALFCLAVSNGMDLRGLFDCKKMGDNCDGMPKCCGDTQCYWKDGWALFTDGVCVECIQYEKTCQKDSQCCSGLVCDKLSWHDINGRCMNKRYSGPCYSDDQCVNDCKKRGANIYGQCE